MSLIVTAERFYLLWEHKNVEYSLYLRDLCHSFEMLFDNELKARIFCSTTKLKVNATKSQD